MRGERHGEDRYPSLKPGLHQTIHHRLRDKVVPIDPAIHDKGGGGDSRVAADFGQVARQPGHFKSTRHVEDINLFFRNALQEANQCLVDDIGMPFGFHKSVSGVCHM